MDAIEGVSVESYLHSTFPGPDPEYRDGALLERSRPDYLHRKARALLIAFFMSLRKRLSLFPSSETRMMLHSGCFLIPDVAVFHPGEPPPLPDSPPLIAIVWLADPHSRRLYTCDGSLREVSRFELPELALGLTPAEIFD